MATWLMVSGFSGYFESNGDSFSLDGDGVLSKVTWSSYEPSGTKIKVYTSLSFDGGFDWTDWRQCLNGGSLPDLDVESPVGDVKFKYRVFLESKSPTISPRFDEIKFEFEPVIVFDNKGDTVCQPELWITMNQSGNFSLTNLSHRNEEFKFVNLVNGETVYVNNEREHIETDRLATYRYSNFNNNYLKLPVGKNVFRVNGNAKILFRYQFKYI
jgi:hypothetical protein